MNYHVIPQTGFSGQPEIYRLLKIGDYSIVPSENSFEIKSQPKVSEKKHKPGESKTATFTTSTVKKLSPLRGLLFYPVVFAVSFLLFYGVLNLPSLIAQASGILNNKSQDEQVLGSDLNLYNQWIHGYFYAVNNKDLLSANNDIDADGLTNHDEFIMRTNPTVADSDADGMSDGVEILDSSNPWGAGAMSASQQKLREKLDVILVSERISYHVSSNFVKNSDQNIFDLNRAGKLSIPKLNLQAPLIFSKDPSDFDSDLEHGVIHYPGTALPGETGVMYVSGHSSDYIWKHDPFAQIFTKINRLSAGDDIFVTVYGVDGKEYTYRYRVTGNKVYKPDDQTQFIDNSSAKLNLSTCWPIGTQKDRLVVTAELVGL